MLLYDVPMEVLAMAHRMCLIPPLTLVVGLLAAAAAPVAAAKQKPIAPSSAFKLPAATRCLAKPELRLQLKTIRGVRWKSVSPRSTAAAVRRHAPLSVARHSRSAACPPGRSG